MNRLPKAKTANIVVQDLGNELLVYDLQLHKAYTLNETAKRIFESCDGKTSLDDLKRRYEFTDDLIYFALDKLKDHNLLGGEYVSPFAGMNRREVIRKIGLASVIALPAISYLSAPSATQAASNSVCTPNAPNCVPANGQYRSTQPDITACFGAPGASRCCTCSRIAGTSGYDSATKDCFTTCT